MERIEIVDVTDEQRFGMIPACADPSFDHRSCDYWEDADRGVKTRRANWLPGGSDPLSVNPFAPVAKAEANPFAPAPAARPRNPFLEDLNDPVGDNPFAPQRPSRPRIASEAPRKLQLLGRGLGIFGSYAKVLLADGEAVAYCQFGPLSAYPRASRVRELYPRLPDAPLPAVITCIATTTEARRSGLARKLVDEVCRDLADRGFAAVEVYPEAHAAENATPAARPEFWIGAGFKLAIDDERYPVLRREL
jgi:ribosomal protein S18 acetylase RimI-like enzyme